MDVLARLGSHGRRAANICPFPSIFLGKGSCISGAQAQFPFPPSFCANLPKPPPHLFPFRPPQFSSPVQGPHRHLVEKLRRRPSPTSIHLAFAHQHRPPPGFVIPSLVACSLLERIVGFRGLPPSSIAAGPGIAQRGGRNGEATTWSRQSATSNKSIVCPWRSFPFHLLRCVYSIPIIVLSSPRHPVSAPARGLVSSQLALQSGTCPPATSLSASSQF